MYVEYLHLKFYQSNSFILFNEQPSLFSSTLLELHINVYLFDDCLYLLDGRLNQLHTLFVNVYDISSGQSVNVLAAAIIGTDPGTPVEVINNIVVDGPANVTVTCGTSATCFVTYRKE